MEWLIGIGIAVAAIVLLLVAGYVKSPPDTAYLISGFRKPRILTEIFDFVLFREVLILKLLQQQQHIWQ